MCVVFFFKQKTAYEMRISDWSSDVCSSDLLPRCLITMQREKRTYGYFSRRRFVHTVDQRSTDEIAINPSYFAVVPLIEILQTIVHEMVHAWQAHFGKQSRPGYHNQEWAAKMEESGRASCWGSVWHYG